MTREEVLNEVLQSNSNLILELATSMGKSRLAIEKAKQLNPNSILIVIPRLVLIQNWKEEFKKWNAEHLIDKCIFSTYVGLHNNIGEYDFLIGDECFTGDTEILTEKGFIRFDSLPKDVKVAQWENGNISFVSPIRYIEKEYEGDIVNMSLRRGRVCRMTPNHQQVYINKNNGSVNKKAITDIAKDSNFFIPTSGKSIIESEKLTNSERLFIAIQADGTIQRQCRTHTSCSIQLSKKRKIDRLLSIIENLENIDIREIRSNKEGYRRWMITLPKGDYKNLSAVFSLNMSYKKASQFIEEVMHWDGYRHKNLYYYSSKIKENVDFVNAVASIAGFRCKISTQRDSRKETFSDIHRIYMYKDAGINCQNMRNNTTSSYKGKVYCVEVPSHNIIVRSEGVTFVSGNCHRLTENSLQALKSIKANRYIFLSATLPKWIKKWVQKAYDTYNIEVTLNDAISNGTLPQPIIVTTELRLEEIKGTFSYIKGKKGKVYNTTYANRWSVMKIKGEKKVVIECTASEYHSLLNEDIEYFKKSYMTTNNTSSKNKWLKLCGDRLKFLSSLKNDYVKSLVDREEEDKVMVFCSTIEQAEYVTDNAITSKHPSPQSLIDNFNKGIITKASSCNMLNEGISLVDCPYFIFASLNSSEIMQVQRCGRSLRHTDPVIHLVYFTGTREEELVKEMTKKINGNNDS